MSERIDLQNAEKKYGQLLSKLPGDETILPEIRSLILKFLRDSELGKTIRNAEKKKIGYGKLLRVGGILKLMNRKWFCKPFADVTQ